MTRVVPVRVRIRPCTHGGSIRVSGAGRAGAVWKSVAVANHVMLVTVDTLLHAGGCEDALQSARLQISVTAFQDPIESFTLSHSLFLFLSFFTSFHLVLSLSLTLSVSLVHVSHFLTLEGRQDGPLHRYI